MSTATIAHPALPVVVAPVVERNGTPVRSPDDQGWDAPPYRPTVTWQVLTITDCRYYHRTIAVATTDLAVQVVHLATICDLAQAPRAHPGVPTPDDLRQFDRYLLHNPISHQRSDRPGEEVCV